MNKILEFDNYVNRGDLKLCLTSGSFFFFSVDGLIQKLVITLS